MSQFKKIVLATGLLAISTFVFPASARAATHVVHPGESIQAAVDAAEPGDTVVVKAGTYRENVTINKSDLTLKAQGTVTLEPPSDGPGQCLWIQDVGICVAPAPGSYYRVRDVTITGFRVVGFPGSGIFGYHTRNLKVSSVVATENAAYGVASFDGIGTTFTGNAVSGSHDAGIYIGDSLEADAVVSHNHAWNNALGILVRHSRRVLISGNESRGNCIGVFLLADGQAGGSGETAVINNTVVANNDVCTQFAAVDPPFLPILGGGGIVLAGSERNSVLFNDVRDNRSSTATMFSGGIVLIATPRANEDGSFDASTDNLVALNRLRGNQPADIVNDAASTPNVIAGNQCRSSVPGGLCGF
jgi:hypothetical protein